MKFCPDCGTNVENMKFCPECGFKIGDSVPSKQEVTISDNAEETILEFSTYLFGLEGKKKGFVNMPTENYKLTNERLLIEKQGVVSKNRDEIELYSVKDIVVDQGIKDKLMKVGDIKIIGSDESTPTIILKRIKDPNEVKESIRRAVMNARKEVGISYRRDI